MDDHRIIDHDADCQNQTKHGDVVQRKAHVLHKQERWHNRRRDGKSRNHRRAPVANEQQNGYGHQHGRQQQVELDFVHRFANESRLILRQLDLDVRWQRHLNRLQTFLDSIGDFNRVGSRLFLHKERNCVLSVQPTEPREAPRWNPQRRLRREYEWNSCHDWR